MQQPDLSRVAGVISDNIRGSCPMFVLTIVTRGHMSPCHMRGRGGQDSSRGGGDSHVWAESSEVILAALAGHLSCQYSCSLGLMCPRARVKLHRAKSVSCGLGSLDGK